MGYEDRDYMREGGYPRRPPGMPGPFEGAPVTKWLVISNLVIAVLSIIMTPNRLSEPALEALAAFNITQGIHGGQIWRLLTFQFIHGGLGHVIFNCIGLYFFGPHVERWLNSRSFLVFYLLCGIAGALFYTLLYYLPGFLASAYPSSNVVGASAGIFGILAAFYYIAPNARVFLFFVIPMQMRTMALIFFAMETLVVLFDLHNSGGSAGHLGGALVGLLILKNAKARQILGKISSKGGLRKKKKTQREARVVRETPRSPLDVTKEVDRILDKIGEKGMHSLTKEERAVLEKARRPK